MFVENIRMMFPPGIVGFRWNTNFKITKVVEGSPAHKMGVKGSWIIVAVNGEEFSETALFEYMLGTEDFEILFQGVTNFFHLVQLTVSSPSRSTYFLQLQA